MARGNGRSINVKIATTKVIEALESKLVQLKEDKANQRINVEKYDNLVEKWKEQIGKLAVSAVDKAEDISASTRYNGDVIVQFTLPKGAIELPDQPSRDFETYHDWQFKEMIEEIENAIRILKLTDEEVVSTSTYNSIAKYL